MTSCSFQEKNAKYDIWNEVLKLKNTGLTLRGHSRGSERSGFYIQELKTFLDAGVQSQFNPENILVTHSHSDHSYALPMLVTHILTVPNIYVPNESKKTFENLLDIMGQLNPARTVRTRYHLTGATVNHEYPLGRNHYFVAYALDHTVPTLGYGIYEKRNKLKQGYVNHTKRQLIQAKKDGTEIMEEVVCKKVIYLCDTSIDFMHNTPEIFEYPVVIVECTFLHDDEINLATQSKHIHWNQLKPFVTQNLNTMFVLVHFSARYTDEEIKRAIYGNSTNISEVPLPNVVVWLN